jgi:hypothetical protein
MEQLPPRNIILRETSQMHKSWYRLCIESAFGGTEAVLEADGTLSWFCEGKRTIHIL